MKKQVFTVLSVLALLPFAASAQINSINGQTAGAQILVTPPSTALNSMHMEIIQQGNATNRFRWDGTPWRIDQGGTGVLSLPGGLLVGNGTSSIMAATILSPLTFASGQLGCQTATSTQSGCLSSADWIRFDAAAQGGGGTPAGSNQEIQFNNNGAFGANSNFVFDTTTGFLGVGTSTRYNTNGKWEFMAETAATGGVSMVMTNYSGSVAPGPALIFRGSRGTQVSPSAIINGDTLGIVAFSGHDGNSFAFPSSAVIRGLAAEDWTATERGSHVLFQTTLQNSTTRNEVARLTSEGNFGVGTSIPAYTLDIKDSFGADSDTTTLRIDADGPASSCLIMKDSDGNGYTYITVNNGTITPTTTPCD